MVTIHRQSWPTRVDVHQDVSDGLGGPAMSHPGGPQSPARSAESLHKGPRPKTALPDLSQRPDNQQTAGQNPDKGLRPLSKPHSNPLRLGSLTAVGSCKTRSLSLFSVEEDEEEEGEDSCSPSAPPAQVVLRSKVSSSVASSRNRLTSRLSAPVLNQIHEDEKGEDEADEEEEGDGDLKGLGLTKPSLSLNLNSRAASPPSPKSVGPVAAPIATWTPSSEMSDDNTESRQPSDAAVREGTEDGEKRPSAQDSPSHCTSPGSVLGQGKNSAKASSGLVESLKLMSLCFSS